MSADFRFLMISAMYENGGNTTQRLLDGHPQMLVYPFESQLGTTLVVDALSSVFPIKYRWPVFALDASPQDDYHAIIDEEAKVRARTPDVSKFRHVEFQMSDDERRDIYVRIVGDAGRCVSIEHFGASADFQTLYREFGITVEAVVAAARDSLAAIG